MLRNYCTVICVYYYTNSWLKYLNKGSWSKCIQFKVKLGSNKALLSGKIYYYSLRTELSTEIIKQLLATFEWTPSSLTRFASKKLYLCMNKRSCKIYQIVLSENNQEYWQNNMQAIKLSQNMTKSRIHFQVPLIDPMDCSKASIKAFLSLLLPKLI